MYNNIVTLQHLLLWLFCIKVCGLKLILERAVWTVSYALLPQVNVNLTYNYWSLYATYVSHSLFGLNSTFKDTVLGSKTLNIYFILKSVTETLMSIRGRLIWYMWLYRDRNMTETCDKLMTQASKKYLIQGPQKIYWWLWYELTLFQLIIWM